MDLGLKGKKAFITGGATGIGEAICLELAKEGVLVSFTSATRTASSALSPSSGEKLLAIAVS